MSTDAALFELIAPRALEPELVDWLAEQLPQERFLVSEVRGHNHPTRRMNTAEQVEGTLPLLRLTVQTGLEPARGIGPAIEQAFPRARLRWWVLPLAALGGQ